MLRLAFEQLMLFALPFLGFAAYLLLARRPVWERTHWDPQWTRLVLGGLFLVVASLVLGGLTATRHPNGYVPAHMENGQLVPGRFE